MPFQAELPLFRFGLRHLLWFVAAVSTLLAALVSLEGMPALALLLAALVVCLHLLGAAIGSRLRQSADRDRLREPAVVDQATASIQTSTVPSHGDELTLQSPWYGRTGVAFAWMPRLVAIAVFCGGCLGGLYLVATIGDRSSLAGLVVGTISSAALCGWFAFLAGNFFRIVRGGLSESAAPPNSAGIHRSAPG
jgi:hypothetical protein